MNSYEIAILSKEWRYITIEAETEDEARDKIWESIGGILNRKPDSFDTDLYIESVNEVEVSDDSRSYGPQGESK